MEILKINQKNLKEIINIVEKAIKEGKVIVFPTDTIYGLICDATNKKAVQKIFKIKKRNYKKPIPVFVKDIKMAREIAFIDKKEEKFLKSIWPGKVTAVLNRKKTEIKLYGVDKKTIALRIPKYKLINNLFKKINIPLAETSVNISVEKPIGEIKTIIRQFENQKIRPDLIIDGGILASKASKVIDLTKNPPRILRL